MSAVPWRVLDFCRHFGIDASSAPAGAAAAHVVFPQLAQQHSIPLQDAAAWLRAQNEVEAILAEEQEDVDDAAAVALDVLRGWHNTPDSADLRGRVAQLLSNRRRPAGAAARDGKDSASDAVQAEGRHGSSSPARSDAESLWRKLMSTEAALFSIAVDLGRKEGELNQREEALGVRELAVRDAEAALQESTSVRRGELQAVEAELEARRTALLVEGARVEERQAYLQQVEDELKGRLNETRHVGENLAAEKVALRAEQARLLAERAAVEQDRRQCNEVAHGFVERERRLKEAEKKLSQVKDDLAAYEAFLRARGSDGA